MRRIGSPPQVRGKPGASKGYERSNGITPAGAGKTTAAARLRFVRLGSPPQVRGKLGALPQIIQAIGITPAGAGKTVRHMWTFAEQ